MVKYSLYVPPHIQREKGPFPLVVFLDRKGGTQSVLPDALVNRIRQGGRDGRFDFVAFCPIDPTGQWQPGSEEVEGIMNALDHVIRRHAIDPARIYLTGIFNGADGVWRLAEAYPDKWAALAPVCSNHRPDVQKIGHIPVWFFDTGRNPRDSSRRQEALLQTLRQAGADVRFTDLANRGISLERQVYKSKDFYDWLAGKKKN